MLSLQLLLFATCLALSGVVIGVGVPLLYGWVPPNKLYGFRTPQTTKDPQAWYPANQACGYWLVVTGVVTAGIAAGMYAAGVEATYGLFFTPATLVVGVIVMAVQSDAASRRRAVAKLQLQFRLLSLFIVTTLVAIGCAIARIPAPWTFKVGVLFAYSICVVGLSVRGYNTLSPKTD